MSTNSKKNKDYLAEPINSHSQNWKKYVWEVVMNSSFFPCDIWCQTTYKLCVTQDFKNMFFVLFVF